MRSNSTPSALKRVRHMSAVSGGIPKVNKKFACSLVVAILFSILQLF